MFINVKMKNEVPLSVPTEACCNCFAKDDIEVIETDLRHMPLWGLAGAEVAVPIPFPYCRKCKSTASKRRPGLLGFLAISTLLFCIVVMSWLFYFSTLISSPVSEYIFVPVSAVIALSVSGAFFFLRKSKPNQSSYYQPIKITKIRGKWPNSIGLLSIVFTNEKYSRLFISENQDSINNNYLVVR